MPPGDIEDDPFVRLLCYGPIGSRKSSLAYKAVEAGFNVLVFNGDMSSHIKHIVRPDVRKRIHFINCCDSMQTAIFAQIMIKFSNGQSFTWNDTTKFIHTFGNPINPNHAYYVIEGAKLNKNWIVCVDSISALAASFNFQFYSEKQMDIEDPDLKPGFDGYHFVGFWLKLLTNRMKKWPCHTVMTAHEQVVDLTKKGIGKKGEVIAIPTGQQHTQMIGASKEHARTMGIPFSDVLHHYFVGDQVYVTTKPSADREGKSRLVFDNAPWEKMQFKRFADVLGIVPDGDIGEGVVYYPPGELNAKYAAKVDKAIEAASPSGSISFSATKLDSTIKVAPLDGSATGSVAPAPMQLNLSGKGK